MELQKKRFEQETSQREAQAAARRASSSRTAASGPTSPSTATSRRRTGSASSPIPGSDQAWIRFSNAAALIEDDLKLKEGPGGEHTHGSRGMALKVLDVEGEMLDSESGGTVRTS